MGAVVACTGLTKTYPKGARGVEDLTFEVHKGEVFGFLGPNGAGKTTTMRVLLDLIRPTAGEARVFGLDAREGRQEIHARTGYLAGDVSNRDRLTARERLRFFADLRGGLPEERIEALAERLGLDLDRPVRALSRGNRQKVGLVQALMHEPELLILDEPTSGLDPLVQQAFNGLVRDARAAGRTVFLSSHILPEVEALCDRVGIIREGRLVAVARMDEVKARAVRRAEARFARRPAPGLLDGVPGVESVEAREDALHFQVRGPLGPALRALADAEVADLHVREPTLEDLFLGFYARADAAPGDRGPGGRA